MNKFFHTFLKLRNFFNYLSFNFHYFIITNLNYFNFIYFTEYYFKIIILQILFDFITKFSIHTIFSILRNFNRQ